MFGPRWMDLNRGAHLVQFDDMDPGDPPGEAGAWRRSSFNG